MTNQFISLNRDYKAQKIRIFWFRVFTTQTYSTVKELSDKGVNLSATEQPISTKDATSKCFLDMLGVFAELETNLRKERQNEGILRAKQKGVYKGRKSSIDADQIKELKESGLGATAIAKQLGIHRDSVYRVLKS